MRALAILLCSGLFVLAGCAAQSADGSVTDDSNEINEGRGTLERKLDPPIAAPTSPLIGAKMSDVLTEVKGTATAGAAKTGSDGCATTQFKDAKTKKVIVERLVCKGSEVIRVLDTDGTTKAEHSDLNKDGKVDSYAGESGPVVRYADTNFDGKIDLVIERVDLVKDFSMKGYDEVFPKSKFLHRIREDQNRDGKLETEKLTALGTLPAQTQE